MGSMRNFLLLVILGVTPSVQVQSVQQPDVPTALYERKGDRIVDAPPGDFAVAQTYHAFPNKGPVKEGQRLTILTSKRHYGIGEPVRVIHVLESITPGNKVYVMGPKTMTDEYVDGKRVTAEGPLSEPYRGAVLDRPIADFNYEITIYTFTTAGRHTIQWKGYGGWGDQVHLDSNTITIEVGQ